MSMRKLLITLSGLALGALVFCSGNLVRAQEEPQFRPELEQLRETVCERLEAVADKLGLTDDQRTKIREAHNAFAEKYKTFREQRRELLQSELEALAQVLTPEQRETAKEYVEDFRAAVASREWPEMGPIRETLADRLHAAFEKLNLTAEQEAKIREAHAPFAEKYRAQRAEHRQLVHDELKAISEVLTPEQREKLRSFVEARMMHAPAAHSMAHRIHVLAERLGITSDQLMKIRDTHREFAKEYDALFDQRDQLLQEEFKALGAILTPEQREKVAGYFSDRIVMIGGDLSRLDEGTIAQLRETIAERLEGVADKLGLTDEQKTKIKEAHEGFIPKYRDQRDQRRALRQKELDALSAILSAEQREKIKDLIGDQYEPPKGN